MDHRIKTGGDEARLQAWVRGFFRPHSEVPARSAGFRRRWGRRPSMDDGYLGHHYGHGSRDPHVLGALDREIRAALCVHLSIVVSFCGHSRNRYKPRYERVGQQFRPETS